MVIRSLRPSHTHCANQKPNGSTETLYKHTAQTQLLMKSPPMLFCCLLLLLFFFFRFPALPALLFLFVHSFD